MKLKYSTPIILLIAILSNSIPSLFKGNDNIITWAGNVGYPEYYHYWYLFNHKVQFFAYLFIPVFMIIRGERAVLKFDLMVISLYMVLSFMETVIYLMWGNNQTSLQSEIEFGMLVGIFIIGTIASIIKTKIWSY